MVKSLADELSDILDWVDSSGLGEHAREEANMGLVCFCRGFVCGLRGGLQVTGDTPTSVAERRRRQENVQLNEPKWDPEALINKVNVSIRPTDEGVHIRHSIDEALKDLGCTPDCH